MFVNNPHHQQTKDVTEKNLGFPDRRYLPRWEVHNKIFFKAEDATIPHECFSKDINSIGACIVTDQPLDLNKRLQLKIFLADDIRPIEALGRPIWNLGKENQHMVGIRFERITAEAKDLIFQYAFEYQRDDLMKHWYKSPSTSPPHIGNQK